MSTVRIGERSHMTLRKIAEDRGVTMAEALDVVVQQWEKDDFFQQLNAAYAALKADEDAWNEELEERRLWDQTLSDGITDDEEHN